MIGVFLKPGLFARELLEMSFRRLCAALLQTLAQSMVSFAVPFYSFTAEGFTCAIGGKVNDTQVNTQHSIRNVRCGFRHIESHSKIECASTIDEISLSFDPIH